MAPPEAILLVGVWPATTTAPAHTKCTPCCGFKSRKGVPFLYDVCAYGIVGAGGGDNDAAVISGTVMDGGEGVTQTQVAGGGGGGTRYQAYTKTSWKDGKTKRERGEKHRDDGSGACYDFQAGKCMRGDSCLFAHTE